MKKALFLVLIFTSIVSYSQLRQGNLFMTFGGEGLSKVDELFDQYPQTDSSQANNNLNVSLGLNYAITNYLSIGLYSNFLKNETSTYKRKAYGPVVRYYLPISKFQKLKIYGNGVKDKMDDIIYLKHFLYVESGVLFGSVSHDSVTFNNKEYSLSLGGTIRIPTDKSFFKRIGLDVSVGGKYYTRTNSNLVFSPVIKAGLVFYFDNRITTVDQH